MNSYRARTRLAIVATAVAVWASAATNVYEEPVVAEC